MYPEIPINSLPLTAQHMNVLKPVSQSEKYVNN